MPKADLVATTNPFKNRVKELRYVDVREIAEHPGNWRDHPGIQADAMRGILGEIGIADALLAYESARAGGKLVLIDGHLRKNLAPGVWPVLVVDLDDDEASYALATHDPVAAMALTDKAAWVALRESIAVSDEAVAAMLADVGELPPELRPAEEEPATDTGAQTARAAELQEAWGTALGQLWQIGEQRLYIGDSRDPASWLAVLQDEVAQGVFTSPPYAEQRVKEYGGVPMTQYNGWFQPLQANAAKHLAADGSFFVNIKPHCENGQRVLYVLDWVLAMVRQWDWRLVDELCWLHIAMPGEWPNRFKNEFEPVYHFSRQAGIKFRPGNVKYQSPDAFSAGGGVGDGYGKGRLRKFRQEMTIGPGAALPSNVIIAQNEVSGATVHAAQFPVALPTFFLKAYSDPGDVWVDPCVGGGTTLLAAHQCGRRGRGIEIQPAYAAVVLDRLGNSCGVEPELLSES